MIVWDKVLIVDDSKVYTQLMKTLMAPYCGSVLTASSSAEGIARIHEHADIELVLCDYILKDGDGFAVLDMVNELPAPKPQVLMVTGYAAGELAETACSRGAVGYLSKPTSVRNVINALRVQRSGERRQLNPRWRCSGHAHLLDEGDGCVIWDVYNISPSGAFLETKGPIPVGTEMQLRLLLHGGKADVRARVARVQEPSWMDVAGVGVEFVDLDREAVELIQSTIEFAAPEET